MAWDSAALSERSALELSRATREGRLGFTQVIADKAVQRRTAVCTIYAVCLVFHAFFIYRVRQQQQQQDA